MKKGTKVNVKSINKNGVVMSSSNNRVSVMMADGTAKVFDVSDVEMLKSAQSKKSNNSIKEMSIKEGMGAGKKTWIISHPKLQEKGVYFQDEYSQDEAKNHFYENVLKLYKYAKGGGLGIIPAQGTMFTKDKKHKLDYKKVGDNYEFVVYEGDSNSVGNYNRTSYKKKNDGVVVMNYNQFKNYIHTEGYINNKYAKGGSVAQDRENVEMVLNNNKQIAHHTKELPNAVKGKKVPAWVVAKVNRSASDLSDATHYMDGQEEKYEIGGFLAGAAIGAGATYYLSKDSKKSPEKNETKDTEKPKFKKLNEKEEEEVTLLFAIVKDGFDYAIRQYSDYKKLNDSKFDSLRKNYISNVTKLESHLNKRTDSPDEIDIDKEGIEYGFLSGEYSDWKKVKDAKFQSLLKNAKASYNALQKHIKTKYKLKSFSEDDLRDRAFEIETGEKFETGGALYNNDSCIQKVVDMVSSTNSVADYYIADKKLVIILKEELGVYDVDVLNNELQQMDGCSNVFDNEFEIGYGEGYKTLVLSLKTNDFTKNMYRKGGSMYAQGGNTTSTWNYSIGGL